MKEGEKIYVESLLSDEEWKQVHRKYPETCHIATKPTYFKSEMGWRHGMGASLSGEEIKIINKRIDEVLKKVRL